MPVNDVSCLLVESLADGVPVLACENYWYYISKCLIALNSQGHANGVVLNVDFNGAESLFEMLWDTEITEEMIRTGMDLVRATEDSACAIAFLLVRELTPYTAVEQSRRYSGVDYYLSFKERDDDLMFNNVASLEVSGILCDSEAVVNRRVDQKIRRAAKYKRDMPVFVVVVEHSRPFSRMVAWNESGA